MKKMRNYNSMFRRDSMCTQISKGRALIRLSRRIAMGLRLLWRQLGL